MGRLAGGLCAGLLWLGLLAEAHAQVQAADSELVAAEHEDLVARSVALDLYLEDVQRPTRAYVGTWIAALGALAIGQGTLAIFEDQPAERAALIGGATLSALGAGVVGAIPAPGRYASKRYRRMPSRTPAELRAKVRAGEALLYGEAKSVRRARSIWAHVSAGAVGVGITLWLGLAYEDNWARALVSGVGAVGVIEARVWTRAARGLNYESRYRATPTLQPALSVSPSLGARALGLRVQLRF